MQAISPAAFLLLYWTFRIRLTRRRYIFDPRYSKIYLSSRFNMMLLAMQAVTSLLLIRAVMRAAAFCNGFHPSPTNTHTVILTFDDTLVLLAAVLLTAVPAGFGSFSWEQTSPFSSSRKDGGGEEDLLPLRLRRRQHHAKVSSISKPVPFGSPPLPPSEERPPVRPYRAPPPPVEIVAKPAMVRHPYDPKTPPVFLSGQAEGFPPLLPGRMGGGHAKKPSWPMPVMGPAAAEGGGLVGRDTLWT